MVGITVMTSSSPKNSICAGIYTLCFTNLAQHFFGKGQGLHELHEKERGACWDCAIPPQG